MPCDSRPEQRTAAVRAARARALARLERAIREGRVRLARGPGGAVLFRGWPEADKAGLTDPCAFRALQAGQSSALAGAVARLAASGQRIESAAVGAGTHSHDGGKTWGPGHG